MKKLLCIGLLMFFYLQGAAVAPYPTLLTTKYKDQLLPVVKVKGSDPVVIVKGHEKRIRHEAVIIPQRADAFGENYIEIIKETAKTIPHHRGFTPMLDRPAIVEFAATLRPNNSFPRGFIMIGLSDTQSGSNQPNLSNTEYVIMELPKLPAGLETTVSFTSKLLAGAGDQGMEHFIQIFDSKGREIMTNKVEEAWRYYALLEMERHQRAMKKYLEMFAGKDHQAFPVVHPKPVFPAGTIVSAAASAVMTISPDGYAKDVITNGLPGSLHEAAIQALEGWLFMPQLKAGKPVPSRVQVPILF